MVSTGDHKLQPRNTAAMLTTPENTITYHNALCLSRQILGVKLAPRETENNAYATFWGEKQRSLWYVVVFLKRSIVC